MGKDRLNRIELRAEELGLESLNIAMQANGKGMPSTDQSRAMRDNWMPEGVEPEFRVPVLRAPRTRREQQLAEALDGGVLITEDGAEFELYGGRV